MPVSENFGEKLLDENIEIEGTSFHICSAGKNYGYIAIIKINGKEYSKNGTGLNIVVYDKLLGKVIDNVIIDSSNKAKVTR